MRMFAAASQDARDDPFRHTARALILLLDDLYAQPWMNFAAFRCGHSFLYCLARAATLLQPIGKASEPKTRPTTHG